MIDGRREAFGRPIPSRDSLVGHAAREALTSAPSIGDQRPGAPRLCYPEQNKQHGAQVAMEAAAS